MSLLFAYIKQNKWFFLFYSYNFGLICVCEFITIFFANRIQINVSHPNHCTVNINNQKSNIIIFSALRSRPVLFVWPNRWITKTSKSTSWRSRPGTASSATPPPSTSRSSTSTTCRQSSRRRSTEQRSKKTLCPPTQFSSKWAMQSAQLLYAIEKS